MFNKARREFCRLSHERKEKMPDHRRADIDLELVRLSVVLQSVVCRRERNGSYTVSNAHGALTGLTREQAATA
ncbi:MAG: hypothetical protein RR091_10850, partial [Cloacibacillus sp.]